MRPMIAIVLVTALVLHQLPSHPTSAASDGVLPTTPELATDVALPAEVAEVADDGPLTVCTADGCAIVSGPVRSVVRTVVRTPVVTTRAVVRTVQRPYRAPVRRWFAERQPVRRVGRAAARVATAPVRWLRCRR